MYLVLLGAPGAGKGTQAVTMARKLGLPHVSSGDLFRAHLGQGTELGRLAQSYMDRGELVPDDVTVRMTMDRLAQPDCAVGAILDGFPRTYAQAMALDAALAETGRSVGLAVLIDVSDEELLNRLGGRWICTVCQTPYHIVNKPPKVPGVCDLDGGELYQRADDSIETARTRLEVYNEQTAPLIDYYRRAGKLKRVDGQQSVEAVQRALLDAVRRAQERLHGGAPGQPPQGNNG
ncbi:MAG TPA: adenylate kinase [Dehalococcoidia bacterium]|nr:adenylate kinase [Dehalococcoidia bacterium]